jgi:hypothetical protein
MVTSIILLYERDDGSLQKTESGPTLFFLFSFKITMETEVVFINYIEILEMQ